MIAELERIYIYTIGLYVIIHHSNTVITWVIATYNVQVGIEIIKMTVSVQLPILQHENVWK